MSGAPAALAASLLWGTADFLAGQAGRRHPVVLVALVGQAAGLLTLAAVLALHGADAGALLPPGPRRRRREGDPCVHAVGVTRFAFAS